jgi:hypothetical protein
MATYDQRPRFFEGQYLGAEDLMAAVDYARIRDARHSLAAHTWGIATGLHLTEKKLPGGGNAAEVFIEPGNAWDGFGRPIVVLAPYRMPEVLFADFRFDPLIDADGKGRRIDVWLRYDERRSSPPPPGFAACEGGDERSRVHETFRIVVGARLPSERHADIKIAGQAATVPAAARLNPAARLFYDESAPHQALPREAIDAWLVPLGLVRWLPEPGGPGHFVARDDSGSPGTEKDSDVIRRARRYVGAVAEELLAADRVLRLRDRTRSPSANFRPPAGVPTDETDPAKMPTHDLVWVEGAARFEGDVRLVGSKLDLRASDGEEQGTPLFLRRTGDTGPGGAAGGRSLEIGLGPQAQGDNRLVLGRLKGDGTLDEKVRARSSGEVGIGTPTPGRKLHVEGSEIHSGGPGAGFSFGDRAAPSLVENPTGGERWVWYSQQNVARLWSGVDKLAVKADGNVGIGTTAPTQKLHVEGNTGIRQNRLYLSGGTGWSSLTYNAHHNDGNTAWVFPDPSRKVMTLEIDDSGGKPRFEVFSNLAADPGAWRSHLRVVGTDDTTTMAYSGGKVGIGTTSPTAKLTVQSPVAAQGKVHLFPSTSDFEYDGGSDGLFIFQDTGGRTAFMGGNVGVNTTSPSSRLHVVDSKDADAGFLTSYVAVIENTSGGNSADVLALKIATAAPGGGNNFITFFGGAGPIGRIEASGPNSVTLLSGGADFAESLPLAETTRVPEPGDVVGIVGGRVSLDTARAEVLTALTDNAVVVGNTRAGGEKPACAPASLLGQVAVKVRGPVRPGDYVVASGLNDGVGVAVAPEDVRPSHLPAVVGRAWEGSAEAGVKRVTAIVGVSAMLLAGPLVALMARQQTELDRLRAEVEDLRGGPAR